MTMRKHSPLHDKWHRRVEGQIRCCMGEHPDWFNIMSETHRRFVINSLAKRIVGEIVSETKLDTKREGVTAICSSPGNGGVMVSCSIEAGGERAVMPTVGLPPAAREGDCNCSPAPNSEVGL